MRFGMFISDTGPNTSSIADLGAHASWLEQHGFDHGWLPYVPWSHDPFVALGSIGAATTTLELGTAVVPTYPFHPMAMARSALTVQAATSNRFALGIGPSHPSVIENMYGYSYARPAAHTEAYVAALQRAFELDGRASADDEFQRYDAIFSVPGGGTEVGAPQLLIAALAPRMLRLAGSRCDGTILWFTDEVALETHVVPTMRAAAEHAGRPMPRVVSCMPTLVCDDEAAGRARAAQVFSSYRNIPTYNRILDRGAGANPEDVVLVGTEAAISDRLLRWAELGVTDVVFAPFGMGRDGGASIERTRDALAGIVASGRFGRNA